MKMQVQVITCVSSIGLKYVYVRPQGVVSEKNIIFIDRERGVERRERRLNEKDDTHLEDRHRT
jgi:hypothetical protein